MLEAVASKQAVAGTMKGSDSSQSGLVFYGSVTVCLAFLYRKYQSTRKLAEEEAERAELVSFTSNGVCRKCVFVFLCVGACVCEHLTYRQILHL